MTEWKQKSAVRVGQFHKAGQRPVETIIFPDGALGVRLTEIPQHPSFEAIIKTPVDLLVLAQAVEAAKAQHTKDWWNNSILRIPYFPWSRQDRVCNDLESFSLKVAADLINSMEFSMVVIYDPHSDVLPALINNVKVFKQHEIIKLQKDKVDFNLENSIFVSPDAGAEKKIYEVAQRLPNKGVIRLTKKRSPKTGEIYGMDLVDSNTSEACDTALIIDDICDGGRTFIEAAKVLRKTYHHIKTVNLYVTHGLFTKGVHALEGIDNVFYTNSLGQDLDKSPLYIHHVPISEEAQNVR